MRYLLAILIPPVAVLLCGKPIQFVLNIFLTLLLWIPGVIHAILVVNSHLADKRSRHMERAMHGSVMEAARFQAQATEKAAIMQSASQIAQQKPGQ